jgi:hypothetical protein
MKFNKSTYFSLFFLFCFLASFSVNTYKSVNFTFSNSSSKNTQTTSFSSKPLNCSDSAELIFEENESENENGFEAQFVVLPLFITDFQYPAFKQSLFSEKPFDEKLANPIYIKVCNLRI